MVETGPIELGAEAMCPAILFFLLFLIIAERSNT
jgi:hypothetical protein